MAFWPTDTLAGPTVDAIKKRGSVICGVNGNRAGFSALDSKGQWKGMDIDTCKAVAAAVLGGCSLRGGEGGILGVVIGTAVMQTLYNLIVLMKISDTLEFAIIGMVILLGVIADEVIKRTVARKRATQG